MNENEKIELTELEKARLQGRAEAMASMQNIMDGEFRVVIATMQRRAAMAHSQQQGQETPASFIQMLDCALEFSVTKTLHRMGIRFVPSIDVIPDPHKVNVFLDHFKASLNVMPNYTFEVK